MKIFTEISDFMDNSGFEEKEPEIFNAEVKRIRDLNNSFMYALEEGYKKRMTAYKKEIVDDMIKDGFDFSVIGEIIGGTDDDINKLKE